LRLDSETGCALYQHQHPALAWTKLAGYAYCPGDAIFYRDLLVGHVREGSALLACFKLIPKFRGECE
jgi:hypothetical protein